MLGKPKYKLGDIVQFKCIDNNDLKTGIIAIIDKYGTFEDNSDVSYDILNKEENMFYKHFREDFVIKKIGHIDEDKIWE